MRLGVIGGSGHHYLLRLIEQPEVIDAVAVAGDGHDEVAARWRYDALPEGVHGQWFEDAVAMLDTFKPDIVSIGAVYAYNGQFVLACLERGIPCVSDKPIAADWETLEKVRAAVTRASGKAATPRITGEARLPPESEPAVAHTSGGGEPIVLTEFDLRCDPAMRAARAAVRRGLIGKVVLATAQKSYRFGSARPAWYAQRRDYAGTVAWVASHAIDYLWYTTGKRFISTFGLQTNVAKLDYGSMEEATVSTFELEGDALAVVHADYNRPTKAATHGDDRLRIAGSAGLVEVRDGRCTIVTDEQPLIDVTDEHRPIPVQQELLNVLRGQPSACFSTPDSLYMAEVILHARNAADQRRRIEIE